MWRLSVKKKIKQSMWFAKVLFMVVISLIFALLICKTVESAGILVEVTAQAAAYETLEEKTSEVTHEDLDEEFYYDSLEMMALCVMAEAGGENELGIRLVVDTILNRVDSEEFPDCIWDVIFQPGAFTCVSNGMIEKVDPTDIVFRIITEELENRTDYRPLYFTAGEYPKYGTPLYKVGNHYFAD